MKIIENANLKTLNTFGIRASAKLFCELDSLESVHELSASITYKTNQKLILGGGSNVLFTKNYDGLVLKNSLKGIKKIEENEDSVLLDVQAGEVWHELVLYCIERDLAGIENLSLIPGLVGASPMQNIGAYGVELESVFESLQAFHLASGEMHTFHKNDCAFGYRTSIFKTHNKGQYLITSVQLRLNKTPNFNVSYGAIQQTLEEMKVTELSIKAVSDAVIKIRSSKLPNPAEIGNAGSFFKNPVISKTAFSELQNKFPDVPHYADVSGGIKVPAGWLIEQCGWKGKRIGSTGAHAKQALVLVNYGEANGSEIYQLALDIQASVKRKFHIDISPEVNII